MNTVELLQFSLGNAFGILGQVTADLTQEQADWQPPGIANPIGALYWHVLSSVDYIVHKWCAGQEPLSERAGWREKALTASAPEPEPGGDWLAYMRAIRVNLVALHEYAQAVAEAAQGWLASLTPKDLERKVETPIGKTKSSDDWYTGTRWRASHLSPAPASTRWSEDAPPNGMIFSR